MKFKNRVRKALSDTDRDESLFQRGTEGTAVVSSVKKSSFSVGGDDDDDSRRVYKYILHVTVPGQAAYEVAHTDTTSVPQGQTVPVKVDPDDPENLVIDWRAMKAETTAKWTAKTDATMASVQQMQQQVAPTSIDANDPALEPIAGISLERYAELTVGKVKAGIATEDQQDAWLTTQGVDLSAWKTASEGWAQRMTSQPAISMRFAALYQQGSA